MKPIKKALFSLLLVVMGLGFQFTSFAKVQNQSSIIQNIRLEYHNTNKNLESYQVVKKILYSYSAEGSALKLYYSNNKLKKIYVKHFGETGYIASQYYFKHSKLIFYYNEYVRYNVSAQGSAPHSLASSF